MLMTPNVDCGIYESREIERAFLRLMGVDCGLRIWMEGHNSFRNIRD